MKHIVRLNCARTKRETCRQARRALVKWTTVLFAVALSLVMATPIWAQATTGTISGTVVDPSGQVIPEAKVSATNEINGETRNVTTTEAGDFIFPSLLPGTYTIHVEAAGFQAFQSTGNVLITNSKLSVGTIRLAIGSITETVTVQSQTAQVETVSAENSALLTRDQFSMLPIRGRDVTSALRLLPGVEMGADQEAFGGATGFGATVGSVQGTRSTQQNLVVDGIVANDMGMPSGLSGQVNMDAVQEVKVMLSNYQAEYAGNPGANISMTTRAGTKSLHGGGYYFVRNEVFNANNFMRNKSDNPDLSSKPALYRFHTFGATLGGPIPIPKLNANRDKLFFFYSVDVTLSKIPFAGGIGGGMGAGTPTRYQMPTALERQGNFSQSATKPIDPRTGQRFLNDIIPADRINRNMKILMNLYPLPNVPDNGAWNYETLMIGNVPQTQQSFRIDYKLSDKDTIYVRGGLWNKDTHGAGGTVGYGTTPSWPYLDSHYEYSDESIALNYTHLWSPKIVSDFTAGIRRSREKETKDDFAAVAAKGSRKGLGLNLGYVYSTAPASNVYDLIPNITYSSGFSNATTVGFGSRFAMPGQDVQLNVTSSTTFVRDKHILKAGVFFNHGRDIEGRLGSFSASPYGSFDFGTSSTNPLDSGSPFANQLLGNFLSYNEASTRYDCRGLRYIFEWFGQDTWKVSRKLTLDYGVRFSWTTPFYPDRQGAAFNADFYKASNAPRLFRPAMINNARVAYDSVTGQTLPDAYIGAYVPNTGSITNGIMVNKAAGVPKGFIDQAAIKVQPRFGFAYDPFGDGKTAIRGGGGVFYQTQGDGFWSGMVFVSNPPVIQLANMYNSNVATLEGSSQPIPYSMPAGVGGFERRGTLPVTYNYSLGVQRDISHGLLAEVKYVGTLSRHLPGRRNINSLPFGTRFQAQNIDPTTGSALVDNLLRPFPGYGDIAITERRGTSNYNSLQTTLNRRFARGLEFGVAYTFSKSLDYGSDDRSFTLWNPTYLPMSRNYGNSSFDQTHIFVANWQYDIPSLKGKLSGITKGWQLSGVYSVSSGSPQDFGFIAISDYLGGGDAFMAGGDRGRVNVTCNPNLPRGERTAERFFNTSCISLPGMGDIGNASKFVYRGPGRNNWDMTLFRNFNLGSEERVLTFRAEFYNVFNHTQFRGIDNMILYLKLPFLPAPMNVNSDWGLVNDVAPARQMQFSLRFRF